MQNCLNVILEYISCFLYHDNIDPELEDSSTIQTEPPDVLEMTRDMRS